MESAIIGLIGVVIGSLLATAKDWWLHHYKIRIEGRHLSLMIAFSLDRYVEACAQVATDHGEENEDGLSVRTVDRPKFEATSVAGDWRSVPLELTNRLFNLQLQAESADERIDFHFEYVATPPDYAEGFEERQYQYAKLGLEAFELTNRLRRHADVPGRPITEWPVLRLQQVKQTVESAREQRARQVAQSAA